MSHPGCVALRLRCLQVFASGATETVLRSSYADIGGGVWLNAASLNGRDVLLIEDCGVASAPRLNDNAAATGISRGAVSTFGGGVAGASQPTAVEHVSIVSCTASSGGGGISVPTGAVVDADRVVLSECDATVNGGGWHVAAGGEFRADHMEVLDCSAGISGGAGHGEGIVSVANSTLLRCSAGSFGGAFSADASSSLSLTGSHVELCWAGASEAAGDGGAVYLADSSVGVLQVGVLRRRVFVLVLTV